MSGLVSGASRFGRYALIAPSHLQVRNLAVTGRHSKNVAGKKNKLDLMKSKLNGRLTVKILMTAKAGGVDPERNMELSRALADAHAHRLPKEVIDRALAKAADTSSDNFTAGVFEVYGHGGVALVVCTLSDNANRVTAEVKAVAKKAEVKVASPGSVLFQFALKGMFQPREGYSQDRVLGAAIDREIDDLDFLPSQNNTDEVEEPDTVVTEPELVGELQDLMHALQIPGSSGMMYVPHERLAMPPPGRDGVDLYEQNAALIEAFEELDTVDHVFHNMRLR